MITKPVAKILVAIDDSQDSRLVFEEALKLAKQNNAKLMLLHILSTDVRDHSAFTRLIPYSADISRDELVKSYQEQHKACEKQGLATLRQLAQLARSEGVLVQFEQPIGNPRDLICYFAHTWQADLIVMGRRHHSWLSQWWTGSVSKQVLHHAPCPVQIVQCQTHAELSTVEQVVPFRKG